MPMPSNRPALRTVGAMRDALKDVDDSEPLYWYLDRADGTTLELELTHFSSSGGGTIVMASLRPKGYVAPIFSPAATQTPRPWWKRLLQHLGS